MVFVDEKGRVYQSWASYVAPNELPAGVMGSPERGIYRLRPTNDSVDVHALEQRSVEVGGVVFVLKDYGQVLFMEHIVNAKSFEDLITGMAEGLAPDVFNFVMQLTRTFLDTHVEDLTSVLNFLISTESVL
ncbi:uncharacterized protein LOC117186631 [Drosophila miranda]|uniref:uncharacterized protein LOC117186631 n=1 Tax=Drosophila miranda TaxID=7229 RepID=UPI00143F37AE|nr:uncharacterized protein LOC117186631 [Drosophila miranda]